ncbi:hypothetical protein MAL08_00165 [Leptospira noguchii]|nr:hypothetical protein [Leptospira noguchii]UOG37841.1 hypothetical protein MAL08_00165 [Leptospira noguchii]UOG48790.1 hypothetical protein MAL00_00160 [Leptospira noguchii]
MYKKNVIQYIIFSLKERSAEFPHPILFALTHVLLEPVPKLKEFYSIIL